MLVQPATTPVPYQPHLTRKPGLWVLTLAALACADAAVLVAYQPVLGLGLIALVAAVLGIVAIGQRTSWFLLGAFGLMGGYMALNRGFAGLFIPLGPIPLYIGELALLPLLVVALRRTGGQFPATPAKVLIGWMAFNALLTLPYLPSFGLTAVRDAAIWYYGLYAAVGVAAWQSLDAQGVRRWMLPVFAISALMLPLSLAQNSGVLPSFIPPFADSPIIGEKWDIHTMFLLGGLALVLTRPSRGAPWPAKVTPVFVATLLVLILLPQHRASVVGLAGVLALLVLAHRWQGVLLTIAALAVAIGVLWAADLEVSLNRGVVSTRTVIERTISTANFLNSENTSQRDSNDNTVYWRTIWWQALLEESLGDPKILLIGRGYGPDLRDAVADRRNAFLNWEQNVDAGRPVRSPHNINMTIFARSGLVGYAIWLGMLGTVGWWLVSAITACRRHGDRDNELFGIWMGSALLAIFIVSSFGVILEGPIGAVPFFFLIGLSTAWAEQQRRRFAVPKSVPSAARSWPASPRSQVISRNLVAAKGVGDQPLTLDGLGRQ